MAAKKKSGTNGKQVAQESLPTIYYSDGAANSNLINQLKNQYDRIALVRGDDTVLIHSTDENAEEVKVSKAVWSIITSLVLAATSGKSHQTDGAVMWLGDERVRGSANLEALKSGDWTVQADPNGQGGATRYEAPVNLLDELAMLRYQVVAPAVQAHPAPRKARGTVSKKEEEIDFSFIG